MTTFHDLYEEAGITFNNSEDKLIEIFNGRTPGKPIVHPFPSKFFIRFPATIGAIWINLYFPYKSLATITVSSQPVSAGFRGKKALSYATLEELMYGREFHHEGRGMVKIVQEVLKTAPPFTTLYFSIKGPEPYKLMIDYSISETLLPKPKYQPEEPEEARATVFPTTNFANDFIAKVHKTNKLSGTYRYRDTELRFNYDTVEINGIEYNVQYNDPFIEVFIGGEAHKLIKYTDQLIYVGIKPRVYTKE